jgi:hypothetical protein
LVTVNVCGADAPKFNTFPNPIALADKRTRGSGTANATPLNPTTALAAFVALLPIDKLAAFSVAAPPGVNLTSIRQFPFGATVPQNDVAWKSPALVAGVVGTTDTEPTFKFSVPLLVTVTTCAALAVLRTCSPNDNPPDVRINASRRGVPFPTNPNDVCTNAPVGVPLCVNTNAPLAAPTLSGANAIPNTQLVLGSNVAPQSWYPCGLSSREGVVLTKLVPLNSASLISSLALPVFVKNTTCGADVVPIAWSPNINPPLGVNTKFARGTDTPVPDKLILPLPCCAVVFTLISPDSSPADSGANLTATVQDPPGAIVPEQVDENPKSPIPFTSRISNAPLPTFDIVTVCAALTVPTFWLPKSKPPGFTEITDTIGTDTTIDVL